MAVNETDNIVLTGLDWSSKLRDVVLDVHLWNKIIHWHGDRDKALRWVQLQIKLFSIRHPEQSSLSHIISSIAFVEMANPDFSRSSEHVQSAIPLRASHATICTLQNALTKTKRDRP